MDRCKSIVDRVVIRKDPFNGISKQWQADLYFKDGNIWASWCANYQTKKGLIDYINWLGKFNIVRAPYKYSIDH